MKANFEDENKDYLSCLWVIFLGAFWFAYRNNLQSALNIESTIETKLQKKNKIE